jgi:hypothetical protein
MNGVAMNTFTIDATNNITAFASLEEARAAKINNSESFGSAQELAKLAASWPANCPVEIWNSFAGVAPFTKLKPVKRFTNRKVAVTRIWEALQPCWRTLGNRRPTSRPRRGSRRRTHRRGDAATQRRYREGFGSSRPRRQQERRSDRTDAPLPGCNAGRDHGADGMAAHTVRGFVSGTLIKKLGLNVESFRSNEKERTYRVK